MAHHKENEIERSKNYMKVFKLRNLSLRDQNIKRMKLEGLKSTQASLESTLAQVQLLAQALSRLKRSLSQHKHVNWH